MASPLAQSLFISNRIRIIQSEISEASQLLASGRHSSIFGDNPARSVLTVRLQAQAQTSSIYRSNAIYGQRISSEAGRIAEQVREIASSLVSALNSALAAPESGRTAVEAQVRDAREAIRNVINSASEPARRLIDGSYARVGLDTPGNPATRSLLFGDLSAGRTTAALRISVGDTTRGGGNFGIPASALNPFADDNGAAPTPAPATGTPFGDTPGLNIRSLADFRTEFNRLTGGTADLTSDAVLGFSILSIQASITGEVPTVAQIRTTLPAVTAAQAGNIRTAIEDGLIDPVIYQRLVDSGSTAAEARRLAPRYSIDRAISTFGASSSLLRETADFVVDLGDIIQSAADQLDQVDIPREYQRLSALNIQASLANEFLGQFLNLQTSSITRLLNGL